jgi:hypothetical protein
VRNPKYLVLGIVFSLLPILLLGQLRDSSSTSVYLGFYRNHYHAFTEGAISIERVLPFPRLSVVGTIGLNPISRRDWILPVWRLNWMLAAEFRYYFAARRQKTMSGVFAGVLVAYDHVGYYYDGTFSPNLIAKWFSFGPTIGYQHRVGARLVVGFNFATAIYPRYSTEVHDSLGNLNYKNISGFGWQYYTFLKVGFRL